MRMLNISQRNECLRIIKHAPLYIKNNLDRDLRHTYITKTENGYSICLYCKTCLRQKQNNHITNGCSSSCNNDITGGDSGQHEDYCSDADEYEQEVNTSSQENEQDEDVSKLTAHQWIVKIDMLANLMSIIYFDNCKHKV